MNLKRPAPAPERPVMYSKKSKSWGKSRMDREDKKIKKHDKKARKASRADRKKEEQVSRKR